MFNKDGTDYKHGCMHPSDDCLWEFVARDKDRAIASRKDLRDVQHSWKLRMQENTFDVGWSFDKARRIFGSADHASATKSHRNFAPPHLRTALSPTNPDRGTWEAACNKECDGLNNLKASSKIATAGCNQHPKKHGDDVSAILSMNLFTIEPDEEGNPIRAKS